MRATTWDIESTDLGGNHGRLLSCSFLDLGATEVETYRRDRRPWRGRKITDDAKLAVAIRDRLEESDIIIGWNSILFDVPFVNTRLVAAGERPIRVGEKFGSHNLDLMYYASGQAMRLPGRSLATVSKFFKCANEKTPLTPGIWAEASAGDKEAMDLVVEHNIADVEVTREVFFHLAPFVKKITFNLSEVYGVLEHIPSRKVG